MNASCGARCRWPSGARSPNRVPQVSVIVNSARPPRLSPARNVRPPVGQSQDRPPRAVVERGKPPTSRRIARSRCDRPAAVTGEAAPSDLASAAPPFLDLLSAVPAVSWFCLAVSFLVVSYLPTLSSHLSIVLRGPSFLFPLCLPRLFFFPSFLLFLFFVLPALFSFSPSLGGSPSRPSFALFSSRSLPSLHLPSLA